MTPEQEYEAFMETLEMVIHARVRNVVAYVFIQTTLAFGFIGIIFRSFGLNKTATAFFALFGVGLACSPGILNMTMGLSLLAFLIIKRIFFHTNPSLDLESTSTQGATIQ